MDTVSIFEACAGDSAARARFLDAALAGTGLAGVIDEIVACGGPGVDPREATVDEVRAWLGADAGPVLDAGVARLPQDKVAELFRRPGLLVGLQEFVLEQGGAHWNGLLGRDADLDALASRHARELATRLGPSAGRPAASVARHTNGSPRGRSWSMRRAVLMLAPLAAAAVVMLMVVTNRQARDAGPAGESPVPAAETTSIVRAVVPVDDVEPEDGGAASASTWPAHPWKSLASSEAGVPGQRAVSKLTAGSRDWSRQLRDAPDLSAGQVSAAVTHARDAISTIDTLAASGRLPLADEARSKLQATCRRAVDKLDRLHTFVAPGDADAAIIDTVKSDIASSLQDVETTLEDASLQGVGTTLGEPVPVKATRKATGDE